MKLDVISEARLQEMQKFDSYDLLLVLIISTVQLKNANNFSTPYHYSRRIVPQTCRHRDHHIDWLNLT